MPSNSDRWSSVALRTSDRATPSIDSCVSWHACDGRSRHRLLHKIRFTVENDCSTVAMPFFHSIQPGPQGSGSSLYRPADVSEFSILVSGLPPKRSSNMLYGQNLAFLLSPTTSSAGQTVDWRHYSSEKLCSRFLRMASRYLCCCSFDVASSVSICMPEATISLAFSAHFTFFSTLCSVS